MWCSLLLLLLLLVTVCWARQPEARHGPEVSFPGHVGLLMLRAVGLQRVLDGALDTLLADAPRRSVLMIDSGKEAADGGCALQLVCDLPDNQEI